MHWRNSQTVVNSAYMTEGCFWTASADTMKAQAHSAVSGALASNLKSILVEERMKQPPEYVGLFKEVWDSAPNYDQALASIAAHERTVISDDSPFDRHMRDEETALSQAALSGKALFEGKANCIACHEGPLITDQAFYNIGLPTNPAFLEDPQRQIAFRERMRFSGFEKSDFLHLDRDPRRYRKSKDLADIGKFRTPPLHYLAYTAPYMHNGVFFDLFEAVAFYNKGWEDDPFDNNSAKIKPLKLTEEERRSRRLSGQPVRQRDPRRKTEIALLWPARFPNGRAVVEASMPLSRVLATPPEYGLVGPQCARGTRWHGSSRPGCRARALSWV